MSSYDELKNKGLAQGSLSHNEILTALQSEIKNPPDLLAIIDKLKRDGVLVYKGAESVRLNNIVKQGKRNGFIKRDDIVSSLPHEIVDEEQIDLILEMLKDMGIKIIE